MRCAVYGCKTDNKTCKNVPFFSFPKDKYLCNLWKYACCRIDEINIEFARICGKHFKEDDFIKTLVPRRRTRIKKGSIPSLYVPVDMPIKTETPEFSEFSDMTETDNENSLNNISSAEFVKPSPEEPLLKAKTGKKTSGVSILHIPRPEAQKNPNGGVLRNQTPRPEKLVQPNVVFNQNQPIIMKPLFSNVMIKFVPVKTDKPSISGNNLNIVPPPLKLDRGTQTLPSGRKTIIKHKIINPQHDSVRKNIQKIFTKGMLKKLECPQRRVRWSEKDLSDAISIYAAGNDAYRLLLKKGYPLPGVATLKKWIVQPKPFEHLEIN